MCLFSGLMGYGQGMMKPPKWKGTELRGEVKSIKIKTALYPMQKQVYPSLKKIERKPSVVLTDTYFFDKEGIPISFIIDKDVQLSFSYEYNQEDRIIKKISENTALSYQEETIYKYDLKNNLIEISTKGKSQEELDKYELTYNAKNQLIERIRTQYKQQDTLRSQHCYLYDVQGYILEETISDYNPSEDHWKVIQVIRYQYNEKGNVIGQKELNNMGGGVYLPREYCYTYTYDSQGNYLTQIEYHVYGKRKEKVKVIEREIQYY